MAKSLFQEVLWRLQAMGALAVLSLATIVLAWIAKVMFGRSDPPWPVTLVPLALSTAGPAILWSTIMAIKAPGVVRFGFMALAVATGLPLSSLALLALSESLTAGDIAFHTSVVQAGTAFALSLAAALAVISKSRSRPRA